MAKNNNLLKMPGGVNTRFDFALLVQVQDGVHGLGDELHLPVQVAKVKSAHGLVTLNKAERVDRELVVPILSHSDQVLPLTRQHVGCA